MFEQGKKNAPCIIFIDEIDAVGRHRGAGLGGGNDEREQTLNQLLVEMDGFEANEGVILIAATNRPDVLDPALLRPGRFDRQVVVPNPDVVGREKILKVHMRKVPLATDVDARIIARGTPGFSGADLANLVNEAALMAARRGKRSVTMAEFEMAKDKVLMGAERRSMVMTEEEKSLTAYHEGGHALVMLYAVGHEPLHKVTIIPRGRALGVTMFLPERDKYSQSKMELEAMMTSLFGGRVAEELIFGTEKVTTGAADDIRRASTLARRMVTEFGFSQKLGPLRYSENEEEVFLGHSVTQRKNVSEATAKIIDEEIRRLVDEAEIRARNILTEHLDELHRLAKGLLEFETLSADEIRRIIRGEKIVRDAGGPMEEPNAHAGPAFVGAAVRQGRGRPRAGAATRRLSDYARARLCPEEILSGAAARDAVTRGRALLLAGGPLAFAAVELLERAADGAAASRYLTIAELKDWAARAERATEIERALEIIAAPRAPWAGFALDRPVIMGILNVTPDSFSDGGAYIDPARAVAHGRAMIEAGADIIDVGGESTRPGSDPTSPEEEARRVVPIVAALARDGAVVSVDTRRANGDARRARCRRQHPQRCDRADRRRGKHDGRGPERRAGRADAHGG